MDRQVLRESPKEDLPDLDGVKFEELPVKRMQGALETVDLIVTVTAAVTPLIAAFLTRPSRSKTGKRRVIIDGQRKVFENYDADEVAAILDDMEDSP